MLDDADITTIKASGLYLLMADDGWRGCRRFDCTINGLTVDESGRGD